MCNTPQDDTFQAAAPEVLLAAASSASATPTSPPNSLATASSTAPARSPSLSTGAKAGIGVGAAVAAIAIISLIVWVVLLKRRSSKRYDQVQGPGGSMNYGYPGEVPINVVRKHEMSGYGRPHGMEGK